MTETFNLDLAVRDGLLLATWAGELDRADCEQVRERILTALVQEVRGLVCDLGAVSYIDSGGVHLLHGLAQVLKADGQQLIAIYPRAKSPRQVLEITATFDAIPFYASLDEATAALAIGVIGLAE